MKKEIGVFCLEAAKRFGYATKQSTKNKNGVPLHFAKRLLTVKNKEIICCVQNIFAQRVALKFYAFTQA